MEDIIEGPRRKFLWKGMAIWYVQHSQPFRCFTTHLVDLRPIFTNQNNIANALQQLANTLANLTAQAPDLAGAINNVQGALMNVVNNAGLGDAEILLYELLLREARQHNMRAFNWRGPADAEPHLVPPPLPGFQQLELPEGVQFPQNTHQFWRLTAASYRAILLAYEQAIDGSRYTLQDRLRKFITLPPFDG
ncbi:uncharacterized protein FOMMEDRAFT_150906 [Fomitiporia mediterranea MF3/22]|uniref:uncharacterized protein n=1 Tax=Fomitiporia mediterranea (strain MF3/22) TaxID=694068 RepID=UPI0004407367|nr:uncharacterized protein FOMMEDRAFT_150906 [Fomitiporia mediterranea MF3/22]EJD08198.1 hypothetical protein FOMMEDRAFT_150906 [Fomitiporia mediterranea MF3/22]